MVKKYLDLVLPVGNEAAAFAKVAAADQMGRELAKNAGVGKTLLQTGREILKNVGRIGTNVKKSGGAAVKLTAAKMSKAQIAVAAGGTGLVLGGATLDITKKNKSSGVSKLSK